MRWIEIRNDEEERAFVYRIVQANRRLKGKYLGHPHAEVVVQHGEETAAIGVWVKEANAYVIEFDGSAGIQALEAYEEAFARLAAKRGLTAGEASELIQRWVVGSYA